MPPIKSTVPSGRVSWLFVACIILLLAGLAGVGSGFHRMVFAQGFGSDLHKRWREQSCIRMGINPFALYKTPGEAIIPSPEVTTESAPVVPPRAMHPGGYPPWSYLTGFLLVPPIAFQSVRIYFALLNLAALAVTLCWVWRTSAHLAQTERCLLTAATLAVFAHASTLRGGQYGILVNGLLLMLLIRRGRPPELAEGLALGLAAVKPQTAVLFFLIPLVRRRWVAFATASGFILGATTIICVWVRTGPITFVRQMFQQSAQWDDGDRGLIGLLLHFGVPRTAVTLGGLGLGLVAAAVLLWRFRHHSVLTLAAIAAVVGRLWMYHRPYDNVMLIFLLVPLGLLAFARASRLAQLAFTLVGLSLWAPLRAAEQIPVVVFCNVAVWLFGLAVLLRQSKRLDDRADSSEAAGQAGRKDGMNSNWTNCA
jgi:hypothetical protein